MPTKLRSKSLVEVAKAAGVSTATVSRVLNDLPGVKSETVARVRAAAESLNYRPLRVRRSSGAQSPRIEPRTGNIALITIGDTGEWLQLPVMASVVGAIRNAAAARGFRLMLDEILDPTNPGPLVRRREADGAVIFVTGSLAPDQARAALAAVSEYMPVVRAMGVEVAPLGVDHVTFDNTLAGYMAHDYLRKAGCRHVAFVTHAPHWAVMRTRGQSFLNAAFDAGAPATAYVQSTDPMVVGPFGRDVVAAPTTEQLVDRLVAAKPRPTGLFVANDWMTGLLYPMLIERGLHPERDVKIVSCDHEDVRLAPLKPRPASMDVGAHQIGKFAVARLLARMERAHEPPVVIHIAPTLVLGGGEADALAAAASSGSSTPADM
jgi:LacI family transcriptional regulator